MQKVIIIGCPGSGKSTFARKLRDVTELPLFYLDLLWHKPDRTNIPREEFDQKLADIIGKDKWIIDGNYRRTIEMRIAACDTVFLFDLPTEVCIEGAKSRVGQKREDMPWVETELDVEFRKWITGFSEEQLPRIYELLEKYKEGKEIIVFKTRDDADVYMKRLLTSKRHDI